MIAKEIGTINWHSLVPTMNVEELMFLEFGKKM
jgi:hypothetical protein